MHAEDREGGDGGESGTPTKHPVTQKPALFRSSLAAGALVQY
jgi:hypothetical protein